jgi:hypothetical protein
MKKFMICIISAVLLVGCKDVIYPIWDFAPSNISLIVRDSPLAGSNNLLDPDFEGNILDNRIVVTYNGDSYPLVRPDAQTRAILTRWYGLRVGYYYGYYGDDGTLALLFGEFQTESHNKSHPETFTIDWGDGTSDEVKFDLYVTFAKKGKESTIHRKIWLNGVLQSENALSVQIVK